MEMNTKFWFVIILVTLVLDLESQVRLPSCFGDHMVLQRDEAVNIWGWADPQEEIKINGSWTSDTVHVKTPFHGRWSAQINTLKQAVPMKFQSWGG